MPDGSPYGCVYLDELELVVFNSNETGLVKKSSDSASVICEGDFSCCATFFSLVHMHSRNRENEVKDLNNNNPKPHTQ